MSGTAGDAPNPTQSEPKIIEELKTQATPIEQPKSTSSATNTKTLPPQFHATKYAGGTYMKYEVEYMKKARTRNIFVGVALTGLISSIFFYSMAKVSQDNFTDIDEKGNKIPK